MDNLLITHGGAPTAVINASLACAILGAKESGFEKFLRDVKACHDKYGGVVVVASEGLKYADGKQFVKPVLTVGRSVYFGDVSAHLAYLVLKELGIKARSEKPGLIGRCSSPHVSEVDREEAILMGKTAAKAVLAKVTGKMAGIKRIANEPYAIEPILFRSGKSCSRKKHFPIIS